MDPEDEKRLKKEDPEYLIDHYRRSGSLDKCNDLLKKIFKKKNRFLDQVCLSNILFGRFEETEKEIEKAEIETRASCKLGLTLELKKNIIEKEFEEGEVRKYLSFTEKLFKSLSPGKYKYILVDFRYFKQRSSTNAFLKTEDDKKIFKVYKYKCGTEEYQNILSSIIEYLLRYFDVDMIFTYYFILNVSCFMHGCKLDCIKVGHETIRREMLDPSYIDDLGEDDRRVLYEMYRIKNKKAPPRKIIPPQKKRGRKKKDCFVVETVYHHNIKKKNGIAEEWVEKNLPGSLRKNNKYLNASGVRIHSRFVDFFLGDLNLENYGELFEEEDKVRVVEVVKEEEEPTYEIP